MSASISYTSKVTVQSNHRDWTKSDAFSIRSADNITFNLYLRLLEGPSFEIKVCKNQVDPAEASIDISLENEISKNAHLYNWEQDSSVFQFGPRALKQVTTRNCDYNYRYVQYSPTITCTIIWYGIPKHIYRSSQYDNFKDYAMTPEFSDVTIAVNDVEFPAHKLILAAQSPVFMKMFTTDMRESKESRVSIDDFSAEIIKELITYLYTGDTKAESDIEIALQLLAVAEKYEITQLKDHCAKTLAGKLDVENSLSIFEAADKHNAQELRQKSIAFMASNKAKVITAPDFKKLCREKPELMIEFMILAIGDK